MHFPKQKQARVGSFDNKRCSYHPSVGEAWRKDQEVVRSETIVPDQVLLSRKEPIPIFIEESFTLCVLLASWYPR